MASFALAAIGRDRPGIVAAISEVLFEHGCNIEDSSMTLLRGNFAIMLVFSSEQTADVLERALEPPCTSLGLHYSVLGVEDHAEIPAPSHILTVYGADQPGILYRVTGALADAGVNITDLNSRLVGADEPVYAVMLELVLPESGQAEILGERLHQIASEVGVDLTLRPLDEDVL